MSKNLPYNRADRVADGIFRIISEILCTELSDPRLRYVNVTRVRMTTDLKIARVFFHFVDGSHDAEEETMKGFESARGFLKRRIADELALKFTPEIEFFYDDAIDLCEKIDSLFEGRGAS